MHRIMVQRAERHGELIADLLGEPAALGKGQVMGMAGKFLADQTGFAGDQRQMGLVADATVAGDLQLALLDGVSRANARRPCGGGWALQADQIWLGR